VLRYGETVDSLFYFGGGDGGPAADEYHRTLCEEICSGDRSTDADAWREALELSMEINDAGGSIFGKWLVQLLRRATSRFKLSSEKGTPAQ